jgi:FtsP/CotA-like multicopper oxidase with cupredoxin domain
MKRLIISVTMLAMLITVAGARAHEADHKEEMDMAAGAAMSAPGGGDYLKYSSPAGNEVVLGRENPVGTLQAELEEDEDGREVKVFRLTVKDVEFEVYPGRKVEGWGFNGQVPGPTIRVTEGDRIKVILINKTKEEHTIHIHGQSKPMEMDGVPFLSQAPVKKDETFAYEFEVRNPGTHWYHCHVDSAHHVDMGMYGAFIVDPKKRKLKYDRDYTLILDEWPSGHIHLHDEAMEMEDHQGGEHGVVTEHKGTPRHDEVEEMRHEEEAPARDWYPKVYKPYQPVYDTFLINGRAFPYTEPLRVREGERVLIRLINAGYESHFMHTHSHRFEVVARDGNPVKYPQTMDTVEVGPGQRTDILLKADNPGVWPFHCHRLPHVANDDIYPGGMMTFLLYE